VRADTTGIGSHRGNENQPAALVAMHRGHDRGRDQKRRVQINIDRLVERREINIVEPLVSRDASAVHQDVDFTVLTGDRPGQQVDLFRVGDIRSDRDPAPSALRDRQGQLHPPQICFPCSSGRRPPRPPQARSQSHAHAAAAACHQRDLSVEILGAIISRNRVIIPTTDA